MSQNNENKNTQYKKVEIEENNTFSLTPILGFVCVVLIWVICYLTIFKQTPTTEESLKNIYNLNQYTWEKIKDYKDILNGKVK